MPPLRSTVSTRCACAATTCDVSGFARGKTLKLKDVLAAPIPEPFARAQVLRRPRIRADVSRYRRVEKGCPDRADEWPKKRAEA